MGVNPHNLSAVDAMGSQFKNNIFDKVPGKLMKVAKAARALPGTQSGSGSTNFRTTNTGAKVRPGLPAGSSGSTTYNVTRVPRPHGPAPKTALSGNPAVAALPSGGQPTTTHAMSPKRPVLPGGAYNRPALTSSSPAPRVFAMGTGGSSVTHVQNSSQFANVTPRDNSPYPTHEHPEGSSNLKLQNLTADQPRTNEFTVGSRNAKPGGIAARGSQLEAWAISKSQAVQARQASRKAGGRDKALSTTAKKAENFANQPLKNFAP